MIRVDTSRCDRCGADKPLRRQWRCPPCEKIHAAAKAVAATAVFRAVRLGHLRRAVGLPCVDCAAPAVEYDHRDYSRPLDVVPVCRGCNLRRGPALSTGDRRLKVAHVAEEFAAAQALGATVAETQVPA